MRIVAKREPAKFGRAFIRGADVHVYDDDGKELRDVQIVAIHVGGRGDYLTADVRHIVTEIEIDGDVITRDADFAEREVSTSR